MVEAAKKALDDGHHGYVLSNGILECRQSVTRKIKKLYNKSINNLSGGELQKVAVATCLLQKVDMYALDEPSAFLDVEDRIVVAKFLQKFC